MPAIFSKNCVLTGDLDSYCLVCSIPLPGEEDVLAHIRSPKHRVSLRSIVYLEKYKDDFIKKVNGVYFCEVCNTTFTTAANVGLHVTEETHVNGRRRHLTRVGTSIVFQKNTLIEESAWNGLVEDTCVLCNAEFDDYSTHISEHSHAFNLVKSTLTIDDNNNVYRKVDGGYQCLTCNIIVSDNSITEHLISMQHESVPCYKYNDNNICHTDDGRPKEGATTEETEKREDKGKKDVINETPNKDTDRKKLTDHQSPDTEEKTLDKKPLLMEDKEKATSLQPVTKEVETLAKQYGLSVHKQHSTVYCKACDLEVPATLNCIKEHVDEKHKDMLPSSSEAKKQHPDKIERVNIEEFVTQHVFVECMNETYAIINDTLCLHLQNVVGILKLGDKIVCQLCQIDFMNYETMMWHIHSSLHLRTINNTLVITSLRNEFVRQVKSDLYHCGYCGIVKSDYHAMVEHLATVQHKRHRANNERILQRYKKEESLNRIRDVTNSFKLFGAFTNRL